MVAVGKSRLELSEDMSLGIGTLLFLFRFVFFVFLNPPADG